MGRGIGAGQALPATCGPVRRGAIRPLVLALALLAAALGSGMGPVAAQGVRMVVEDPENLALNLRAGPGIDYPVIRLLTNGTRVAVLELAENWAHVRDVAAGTEGWAWYHNLIWDGARAVPVQIFHPESDGLNIRNGPGTGFRLLTRLPNGARAEGFEQRGNWVWLRRPEGTPLGWAYVAYLHEVGASAPAPAPVPAPAPPPAAGLPGLPPLPVAPSLPPASALPATAPGAGPRAIRVQPPAAVRGWTPPAGGAPPAPSAPAPALLPPSLLFPQQPAPVARPVP